jgi:hypothetical protein
MHGLQVLPLVERATSFPRSDLDAQTTRLVMEKVGIVRRRQGLEPPRHGGAQLVVHVVRRGPQRVTTSLGERVDLEHRIVARDRFKGDIAVPGVGGKQGTVIVDVSEAAALRLLFAADDGDLVSEFGGLFRQGVDVQVGRGGLAG